MPVRTSGDGVAGPILPTGDWAALLSNLSLTEPDDYMEIAEPSLPEPRAYSRTTADAQRRLVLAPLVEQIWQLGKGTAAGHEHLTKSLRFLLDQTAQLVKDRYQCYDPYNFRTGRASDQRAGKLPGEGRRLPEALKPHNLLRLPED